MNDDGWNLEEIVGLPIRARVAFALAVAETVAGELAADPKGLTLAREGLRLSWQWLNGQHVRAAELSQYVDGATDKNLCNRAHSYEVESKFSHQKESMLPTLTALVLAIAYAAREAYELEGSVSSMPSVMWEVDDQSLKGIAEFAQQAAPRDGGTAVHRVGKFLIDKYAHHHRDTMGVPVMAEEALRNVSSHP